MDADRLRQALGVLEEFQKIIGRWLPYDTIADLANIRNGLLSRLQSREEDLRRKWNSGTE